MAPTYWNYNDSNPTRWATTSTNATTNFDTSLTGCGWASTTNCYRITVTRKILVSHPETWTNEQSMNFIELINIKTKTGFTVVLFIKGEVLITDPDVEKRDMIDFIPLLRKKADENDLMLINDFFEKNPC